MTRLSMNEMTTYHWSFEEDVINYAAAGSGAIAVWRQKLADFGEEKGIELLSDSGLQVSSLLWAGGFTGSEGRTYTECVQDAGEAVRLAAAMNAGCLIVYSGARGGHTHNHARRLATGAIAELAPMASDLGVTLAIEPMHAGCAGEWTFLTNLDDALALIDEIASSHVKLAFDTYHLCQDGPIVDRLTELASRIAIVQLGDAKLPPEGEQSRCRLGDGKIPLREIVAALADANYDGFYDVELMGEEIETADYSELLQQSKQAFAELLGR